MCRMRSELISIVEDGSLTYEQQICRVSFFYKVCCVHNRITHLAAEHLAAEQL